MDRENKSLTFAGNITEGHYARLMKANFNRLLDGSAEAAKQCVKNFSTSEIDLAILISCIGRKMVLKQRFEDEIEGASEVFGNKTFLTGFYSYGEISPLVDTLVCKQSQLHNQTMTITTLSEV